MRNGIYTVFVVILDLIPFFIFFLSQEFFWKYLFLFLTIIFSLIAYLNSLHMSRLFDPVRFREIEESLKQKDQDRKKGNEKTE